MQSIIKQHNSKILASDGNVDDPGCNCRQGSSQCPLLGKCLTDNVIYEATVTADNDIKTYIGSCSTKFKLRYNDHTSSFRNAQYKNKTELSSYIWQLKEKNLNFNIDWKIIDRANCYKNGKNCKLCLTEKLYIIKTNGNTILNKSEVMTKCKHKVKFKLKNLS